MHLNWEPLRNFDSRLRCRIRCPGRWGRCAAWRTPMIARCRWRDHHLQEKRVENQLISFCSEQTFYWICHYIPCLCNGHRITYVCRGLTCFHNAICDASVNFFTKLVFGVDGLTQFCCHFAWFVDCNSMKTTLRYEKRFGRRYFHTIWYGTRGLTDRNVIWVYSAGNCTTSNIHYSSAVYCHRSVCLRRAGPLVVRCYSIIMLSNENESITIFFY